MIVLPTINDSITIIFAITSFIIELTLNSVPIGNIVFNKDESEFSTHRIAIPPGALAAGMNDLQILVDLSSLDACIIDYVWVAISETSLIHLETTNIVQTQFVPGFGLGLKSYPELIIYNDYNLNDLAIVLPKSNPAAWDTAVKIMYQIGDVSLLEIPNLTAWYADNVPDTVKNNKAIMVFGRASTLPFISEINDDLPAPFESDSDIPLEPDMRVSYRIPSNINLGYLELLPSPWNPEKPIFAILGNSDQGIIIAGKMLTNPILADQLNGDFAISNGSQVVAAYSKRLTGEERLLTQIIPEAEVILVTPVANPQPAVEIVTQASWIVPAFIVTSIMIIIILGFLLISAAVHRAKNTKLNKVFDRIKNESLNEDN